MIIFDEQGLAIEIDAAVGYSMGLRDGQTVGGIEKHKAIILNLEHGFNRVIQPNDYKPWEAEGISEVEYWRRKHVRILHQIGTSIDELRHAADEVRKSGELCDDESCFYCKPHRPKWERLYKAINDLESTPVVHATCAWVEGESDTYDTECGVEIRFEMGLPTDPIMEFCGFCGKKVLVSSKPMEE